jgi:hypothetical protein
MRRSGLVYSGIEVASAGRLALSTITAAESARGADAGSLSVLRDLVARPIHGGDQPALLALRDKVQRECVVEAPWDAAHGQCRRG